MRYTAYNPDEVVEEGNASFTLVCPLHGVYRCQSERLKQMYIKWNLQPPSCPHCKKNGITDRQYREQVYWGMYAQEDSNYLDPEDFPLHENFKPMQHWNKPNISVTKRVPKRKVKHHSGEF